LLLFVRISDEVANEDAKVEVVAAGILITVFFGGCCPLYLQDVSQTNLASLQAQKPPFVCPSVFVNIAICTTVHICIETVKFPRQVQSKQVMRVNR